MSLTESEKKFIQEAARYLETPSFLIRVSEVVGQPVERSMKLLPEKAQAVITRTVRSSMEAALKAALFSLRSDSMEQERTFEESVDKAATTRLKHGVLTAVTGAAGGFFGLPALAVELPLTTTVMLRSIARTASDFGEDLSSHEAQLECLMVFAMGAPTPEDDAAEAGYYVARVAFANLVQNAAAYVTAHSQKELLRALAKGGSPMMMNFITQLAQRFEVVVTQKFLAGAVPVAGAAAGGALNVMFAGHFNSVAKYHFGLKKLERAHGKDAVQAFYAECAKTA